MINAGKYNKKIVIYKVIHGKNVRGFPIENKEVVLSPYARVKTTRGYALIANNSDFEKAYTNFTIRYSKIVEDTYNSLDINRKLFVEYKGKKYTLEYLNNVDEDDIELEMQCKEVTK